MTGIPRRCDIRLRNRIHVDVHVPAPDAEERVEDSFLADVGTILSDPGMVLTMV